MKKIVRSICFFTENPTGKIVRELESISKRLGARGFEVQTCRVCVPGAGSKDITWSTSDPELLRGIGVIPFGESEERLPDFLESGVSFNIDLSEGDITGTHVGLIFDIIRRKPEATFNFAYVFNNLPSSPYFPSARYEQEGFSIGLQSTDLAAGVDSLDGWFANMESVWGELVKLFGDDDRFLGIDSSIAPAFSGDGSLVHFVRRLGMGFDESVLSDSYLRMTRFIRERNPKPIGLSGLMLPCLEDFELAKEYERGNFSIERNIFLSLHCGLGVDTYPIGMDESPARILGILRLVQGLSNKYRKPLSIRFVSDGQAKIGERTDFRNEYLKDVVVRAL
jgi:hypothetical protein